MALTTRSYGRGSELSAIIREITQAFSGSELRFVVPSRKDKNYWPEHYSSRNLWTWQDIYEDICRAGGLEGRRVLSPPDHMLILRTILREVLREYSGKAASWPGLNRSGFPDILSRDIREMLNEAVPPDKLESNPGSDNPSEFLLPEVYSRYLAYLGRYNLMDSAQIYTAARDVMREVLQWGKDYVTVLAGFMSFNHGQFELVQALRDRCREVIIIKPETEMPDFHDAASQFSMIIPAEKSSGNIIELPVYEPELEPESTARTLALWSAGEWQYAGDFPGFDSVAVMIPQGREESFAEAFKRYMIPYDFMDGIPISQTLPGKILSSVRHLQTRNFPAYDTAMLLTQTCFAGVKFPVMRAYRAGISGIKSWEEYLAEHDSDDDTFTAALLAIRSIRTFTEAMTRRSTPARIMEAFYGFLTAKGLWLDRYTESTNYPELDESIRTIASAIDTAGKKHVALDELLPDIGPVQDERLQNDEAYEFLESWCAKTNTRAPVQVSNAVRIFTGQPPVLAFFPVWIMTDVTQKSWSGNITASPLLGNEERRKLDDNGAHLPTGTEKALQKEALFRRLIQTGENLTVIMRPELDTEGRPVSESPFMQRVREDFTGWNITTVTPAGINIFLGEDGFTFPQNDPEGVTVRSVPAVSRKALAVGASDIHDLLSCPFLWWQKRQAKLYEQDSDIVSPVEWGNMMHRYWQCVWLRFREDMNASGSGKFFMHIAEDEWRKLCEADEGGDYAGFRRLVRDFRLKRKLDGLTFRAERLAGVQAGVIDALHGEGYAYRNILLEEEAHLKADIDGVAFLGQCDRIDILSSDDGEDVAFIADYKEGIGENSEKPMNIKSYGWNYDGLEKFTHGLQLSVYAALFGLNKKCRLSGVYILGLEDGRISGSFEGDSAGMFAPYQSKKFFNYIADRKEEGEYAMKCAVNILKSGEFMPEYKADTCRYCHIKSLCRKGEFRGEIIPESEEE